jgi:hypothetical protein
MPGMVGSLGWSGNIATGDDHLRDTSRGQHWARRRNTVTGDSMVSNITSYWHLALGSVIACLLAAQVVCCDAVPAGRHELITLLLLLRACRSVPGPS